MNSPYEAVYPTIFLLKGDLNWILMKINPAMSTRTSLSKIEAVFKKLLPAAPCDYKFVDDVYAAKFAADVSGGHNSSITRRSTRNIEASGRFGNRPSGETGQLISGSIHHLA